MLFRSHPSGTFSGTWLAEYLSTYANSESILKWRKLRASSDNLIQI